PTDISGQDRITSRSQQSARLTFSTAELDSDPQTVGYSAGTNGEVFGVALVYQPPVHYGISGVVTLDGEPIEGATIRCIRQGDNTALTPVTSDESGAYLIEDLEEDQLYHVAVEYEADDVKYNARSLWD